MLTTTDAEINHNLCFDGVTPQPTRQKRAPLPHTAGRVPRHAVEQLYRQKVEHDWSQELVEATIGQAIEEKQIQPVAPLEVDKLELKFDEPLRFRAKVEI